MGRFTGLPANMKPGMWPVRPMAVAPEWRWFWDAIELAAIHWQGHSDLILYGKKGQILGTGGLNDASWSPCSVGRAISTRAISATALSHGTSDPLVQGDWTVVAVLCDIGTVAANSIITFKRDGSTYSDAAIRWCFMFGSATAVTTFAYDQFPTDITIPSMSNRAGITVLGLSDDGTQRIVHLNGAEVGSQSGSLTFTSGTGVGIQVGSMLGANELDADWPAAYYFGRRLTAAEHLQLGRDPFGPWRMARRRVSLVQITGDITDGSDLGDTFSGLLAKLGSQADGATASDSFAALAALLATEMDGAKLSDAWTALVTIGIADGLSLSDAMAAASSRLGALSDGPTLSDAMLGVRQVADAVADGSTLSDALTLALGVAVADGAVASDSAAAVAARLGTLADDSVLADSFAGLAALLGAQSDGAAMGDSFAVIVDATPNPENDTLAPLRAWSTQADLRRWSANAPLRPWSVEG